MVAGRLCYNADMWTDCPVRSEMKGETPDMKHFRIPVLALATAISLSLAVPAAAAVSDASGTYAESIQRLAEEGVIRGDGTGAYRPDDLLTRSDAASLLYEAFDLVPVFLMEAPVPEVNEDGTVPEPVTKQFYSTDTTVATLAAVLMPAAPDAVGTWAETAANTVLEARLMDQIDGEFCGEQTMTRDDFALAVMKAVYGADKNMDFLAQGAEDGLLPADLPLNGTEIFFKDLYGSLKLNVCEYTFEGHDEVVAYSLSVPFASTLVFASIMKHQDAPGTTFKKHMAIARGLLSEDDYLLTEILFNPKTPAQIDNIVATLTHLSKIIDKKDSGKMKRFLDGVRKNLE